ncbi:hypothetical protein BY458DRAFT_433579 [Sporodiniella umbellata]|nr:hypothetical protein BY458DRAFT_433579 [Sporodiniella umbellata]
MFSTKILCCSLFVTILSVQCAVVNSHSDKKALFVERIEDCPGLPPRPAPSSVTDLRPDDIKVVGALGDSVMAGATSLGHDRNSIIDTNSYIEARGITYGGGGDPGQLTIPNFVKRYSPNVKGGSRSTHLLEYCINGVCLPAQYDFELDQLNAAQSASSSYNIPQEIEYMAKAMRMIPGIDYENDWKMITVQIGGLDQCQACYPIMKEKFSTDNYGKNIEIMLEYVRNNIPRTVVNLIGVFNVTTIYPLTIGHPYCVASMTGPFQTNMMECLCAQRPENVEPLNQVAVDYSNKLHELYLKYKAMQTDSFGVIYTPANLNFTALPIEFFRYHSLKKKHESHLYSVFYLLSISK